MPEARRAQRGGGRKKLTRRFRDAQANQARAAEALLALAGHEPEAASEEAYAGALLVAEFFGSFRALVRGLAGKS